MNIAQMLAYGPKIQRKPGHREINAWITEEMRQKGRETISLKRKARWFAIFENLPDMTASTNEICAATGRSRKGVYEAMCAMSIEEPPMVKKIGTVKPDDTSYGKIIWKWCAD